MPLPYNVWTEQQIKDRNISPDGMYNFEIVNAVQKPTKQKYDNDGNPKPIHQMLEIEFIFVDQNGMNKQLTDWIVFMEGMDWKLSHLAQSVGLFDLYDMKQLEAYHLKGKRGAFHLGVKESVYNGEERRQNYVKDYVAGGGNGDIAIGSERAATQDNNGFDKELPF